VEGGPGPGSRPPPAGGRPSRPPTVTDGGDERARRVEELKSVFSPRGVTASLSRVCPLVQPRAALSHSMESQTEAQACALEPTLGSAASLASRRAVRSLVALQPASRDNRLACYSQSDLGNLVRCALAAGAPANTRCGESDSPVLCIAASNSAARSLKALLTGGADVRLVDRHGCSALHWAAQEGNTACVSLLLEAGAPLEAKNRCAAWHRQITERRL